MNTDKIYAEHLANEYSKKETTKVLQLKKLDRKAKMGAQIFTYSFGIIAALIVGVGMCLSMHVIGPDKTWTFVLGIIIGLIGLTLCGINYPIYNKLLASGKAKYASDIIRLASEITEEE